MVVYRGGVPWCDVAGERFWDQSHVMLGLLHVDV